MPGPFEDFLRGLRDQGMPVGVRERQVLARALSAFASHRREDLRVMIAALLGGDLEGRERVRLVFDQYFPASTEDVTVAELDGVARQQGVAASSARPARIGRGFWTVVGVGALLLTLAMPLYLLVLHRPIPPLSAGPKDLLAPSAGARDEVGAAPSPPPPWPSPAPAIEDLLPEPPILSDTSWRRPAALSLAISTAVVLCVIESLRQRRRARRQDRRRGRNDLPGPHRYRLKLPPPTGLIREQDIDDFAVLLGRLDEAPTSMMDVGRTVRSYAERGLLLRCYYRSRLQRSPILVLRDVSKESQVYSGKIEALLRGLICRGIPLSIWSFDGDAEHLWEAPNGPLSSLSEVCLKHEQSVLMVIALGGMHLRDGFRLRPWIRTLAQRFSQRTWLNPLDDPARWHDAMREDFPISVWPITRAGLRGAAADLLPVERRPYVPRRLLAPTRPLKVADIERARRMIAMVPYAELGLAEHLVRRIGPDLPGDVLWELYLIGTDPSGTVLRWPREDLRRWLLEHRALEAAGREELREQDIRLMLAALYARSVADLPVASVARARGELDVAMQLIYLPERRDEALAMILSATAILGAEEVRVAVGRLADLTVPDSSAQASVVSQVTEALRAGERLGRASVARPAAGPVFAWPREFWLRSLSIVGLMAAGFWIVGGWLAPVHKVRHEAAWSLIWLDGVLKVAPLSPPVPGLPARVGLYRGKERIGTVELDEQRCGQVPLKPGPEGRWYLVWAARQPGFGEVLYSNLAFVPPEDRRVAQDDSIEPTDPRSQPKQLAVRQQSRISSWTSAAAQIRRETDTHRSGTPVIPPFGGSLTQVGIAGSDRAITEVDPGVPGTPQPADGGAQPGVEHGSPGPPRIAARLSTTGTTGTTGTGDRPAEGGPASGVAPVREDMVLIPGGSLLMGTEDGALNERPAHQITVKPFWLEVTEVTVRAYRTCVEEGQCSPPGTGLFCNWGQPDRDDHPVNCVDWKQARAYCQHLNRRLPSEREWEFAARGEQAWRYPWGSDDPAEQLCWRSQHGTCPVASFPAGLFKLHDMVGNVWEWTSNSYCGDYRARCSDSATSVEHAVRGGSWNFISSREVRSAVRAGFVEQRNFFVGIRCAASLVDPE